MLDILTNWEHYVPTLGREIPLFGPHLRTTPRDPFRGVGEQAFSCLGIQAGNFCMVSADCFAERQEQ